MILIKNIAAINRNGFKREAEAEVKHIKKKTLQKFNLLQLIPGSLIRALLSTTISHTQKYG